MEVSLARRGGAGKTTGGNKNKTSSASVYDIPKEIRNSPGSKTIPGKEAEKSNLEKLSQLKPGQRRTLVEYNEPTYYNSTFDKMKADKMKEQKGFITLESVDAYGRKVEHKYSYDKHTSHGG